MNFGNIAYEKTIYIVKTAQNFNRMKWKLIFKHEKSIEKSVNIV